jgi:hypothetical protein
MIAHITPNKITGANAGGPRPLPLPALWAARIARFVVGPRKHKAVNEPKQDNFQRAVLADSRKRSSQGGARKVSGGCFPLWQTTFGKSCRSNNVLYNVARRREHSF